MPIALGLPFLLALPAWRTGLRRAALVAAGIVLVLAPWTIRNLALHGTTGADGALGQALIGRTVRHDKGFRYDDPAQPRSGPDARGARRIIQQEADGGEPSGGTITARVRDELGLTQAQTSALLRELALAEIAERPGHYLASTGEMAWELFQGRNERLLGNWRQRTTRNWDRKWDPRIVALLDPDTPAEGEPYERADAVTSFFQPWRWRTPITWLFGIGAVLALVVPRFRPALAPAATALVLVLAAAALDGLVWRFRYPADPAIAVVAAGGLFAPLALAWTALAGYRLGRKRVRRCRLRRRLVPTVPRKKGTLMPARLNVALVGAGLMGSFHAETLAHRLPRRPAGRRRGRRRGEDPRPDRAARAGRHALRARRPGRDRRSVRPGGRHRHAGPLPCRPDRGGGAGPGSHRSPRSRSRTPSRRLTARSRPSPRPGRSSRSGSSGGSIAASPGPAQAVEDGTIGHGPPAALDHPRSGRAAS